MHRVTLCFQVESDDGFSSKKLYHKEIYYQRFNKSGETSKSLENNQMYVCLIIIQFFHRIINFLQNKWIW